jgi:hypothetical protein
MAPLPVIANVYRVAINSGATNGLTAATIMHFRSSSLDESGIFTALSASGTVAMLSLQSGTLNGTATHITKLDGTSGTQVFGAPTWFSGGGSGEPLAQVCAVVSFRTALRGASHRGRAYLPFVGESEVNAGILNSPDRVGAQTAWQNFIGAMNTADADLVVASYVHSTAEGVTTATINPVSGTQKRRNDRLRA